MYTITSLHVYPIKALKGVSLDSVELTDMGIALDRQWMLIDESNRAVTQREMPILAKYEVSIYAEYIGVAIGNQHLLIPKVSEATEKAICRLFDHELEGIVESDDINQWFSEQLGKPIRLVRKSPESPRYVKNNDGYKVQFSDGDQYLFIGESSMNQLNAKLDKSLDINRFRANVIFSGGTAHDEDNWSTLKIGESRFSFHKKCNRCKVTTIDQETSDVGQEPLKTLSTYRMTDKKIQFGAYFKLEGEQTGQIKVGDQIEVMD